jgi:hypothetical protein
VTDCGYTDSRTEVDELVSVNVYEDAAMRCIDVNRKSGSSTVRNRV